MYLVYVACKLVSSLLLEAGVLTKTNFPGARRLCLHPFLSLILLLVLDLVRREE